MDPLAAATGERYAYAAGNPLNGTDPYGLWCIGPVCSDQVGHVLGQIGNNAGTIVPIAVYSGVVVGTAACAYFTLGVCVAADVATDGLLFGGATLAVGAAMGFAGDPVAECPGITGVPEPQVVDTGLQNIIQQIYKGARAANPIGTGSTADSVRYELRTGLQVGNRWHSQKAGDMARALLNWMRRNPQASTSDRQAAENVFQDLVNALTGK